MKVLTIVQWLCLIPVMVGSGYAACCLAAALRLRREAARPLPRSVSTWPRVTVLKPVYGLEKGLRENLRSTCLQDYPEFQVVCSVQRRDDPAIPLLREIQQEFGVDRVTVVIENRYAGPNGKINNLIGGLAHARHEVLVISDSDVRLRPDYLKTIVAPLADPEVGYVCTLYKAVGARSWFERLELLTLNAEFLINFTFARGFGAADFCLGASTALRRSDLQAIGGLESLADYLVEDFEMGRRFWAAGKRFVILPYLVETVVDLKTPAQWWHHQVYWDQNNRSARPGAHFSTLIIRPVPFALLFALARLGDPLGLAVLAGTVAWRLITVAMMMSMTFRDQEGLRSLPWLPFRDVTSLVSWGLSFTKSTTVWRGNEFVLTRDGRLAAQEVSECEGSSSPVTTSVSPSP